MVFDIDMIRKVYAALPEKINQAKKTLQRPLTLTEKILFAHLSPGVPVISLSQAVMGEGSFSLAYQFPGLYKDRVPQSR